MASLLIVTDPGDDSKLVLKYQDVDLKYLSWCGDEADISSAKRFGSVREVYIFLEGLASNEVVHVVRGQKVGIGIATPKAGRRSRTILSKAVGPVPSLGRVRIQRNLPRRGYRKKKSVVISVPV